MAGLSENRSVRQRPDEGHRRWFVNEFFDLILWYESARGQLTGFQLCYDRHAEERAFTWQRGKQSSHYVSSGTDEKGLLGFATAVLHGDAGPVPETVLHRLEEEQGELDDEILLMVVKRIKEFNAR